jgi:hypothetical protein
LEERVVEIFDGAQDGDIAEHAFQAWRIAHPRGFVLNRHGRAMLLPHADCWHFFDTTAGIVNTKKPKICSTDRGDLERRASANGVATLPGCQTCRARSPSPSR